MSIQDFLEEIHFPVEIIDPQNVSYKSSQQTSEFTNEVKLGDYTIRWNSCNKISKQFIQKITKELSSPLHQILGFLSLLKDTSLTPDQQDWFKSVELGANQLVDDILNLLDCVKYRFKHITLNNELFVLKNCFEGLKFDLEISTETPEIYMGDHFRLRQLVYFSDMLMEQVECVNPECIQVVGNQFQLTVKWPHPRREKCDEIILFLQAQLCELLNAKWKSEVELVIPLHSLEKKEEVTVLVVSESLERRLMCMRWIVDMGIICIPASSPDEAIKTIAIASRKIDYILAEDPSVKFTEDFHESETELIKPKVHKIPTTIEQLHAIIPRSLQVVIIDNIQLEIDTIRYNICRLFGQTNFTVQHKLPIQTKSMPSIIFLDYGFGEMVNEIQAIYPKAVLVFVGPQRVPKPPGFHFHLMTPILNSHFNGLKELVAQKSK